MTTITVPLSEERLEQLFALLTRALTERGPQGLLVITEIDQPPDRREANAFVDITGGPDEQ